MTSLSCFDINNVNNDSLMNEADRVWTVELSHILKQADYINAKANLGSVFHQRTYFSAFIHQACLVGGIATDYIGVVSNADEERNQQGTVLEAVASL